MPPRIDQNKNNSSDRVLVPTAPSVSLALSHTLHSIRTKRYSNCRATCIIICLSLSFVCFPISLTVFGRFTLFPCWLSQVCDAAAAAPLLLLLLLLIFQLNLSPGCFRFWHFLHISVSCMILLGKECIFVVRFGTGGTIYLVRKTFISSSCTHIDIQQ